MRARTPPLGVLDLFSATIHAHVISSRTILDKQSDKQMEQATHPNDDDLPQLRANSTEATQILLLNMEAPQKEFFYKFAEMRFAFHALSKALLRAVPKVGMELGEAYALEASVLPEHAKCLLVSLSEFRKRKGLDG